MKTIVSKRYGLMLALAGTILLALSFQNCSKTETVHSSAGGSTGGADGKYYQSYGFCDNGAVEIDELIEISDDNTEGWIWRLNCTSYAVPLPLKVGDLTFAL